MDATIALKNGTSVRLRTASLDDAAGIVALDLVLAERGDGMVLTPDQVRTADAERARLAASMSPSTPASTFVVAERLDDGKIVGTAGLGQLSPTRCRHVGILGLGIHPEVQRMGLGRALMQALLEHGRAHGLRRLELYVRADNPGAIALYRSLGFQREGTRTSFVRLDDGTFVDDHVFALHLS